MIEDFPKVTIIMPVYNKEAFVEASLLSAVKQTFADVEIIIVNDGSTDGSAAICKQYEKQYSNIIYIEQENQGVVCARNNAVRASRGEYIFPLDADDEIAKECIQLMYEHISSESVDVVYSYVARMADESVLLKQEQVKIPYFLVQNCVCVSAMFRRSDWEKYGGYNENMSEGLEDWDFWLNFVEDEKTFGLVKKTLLYWRVVEGSRNNFDFQRKQKLLRQLIANHPKLYQNYRNKPWHYFLYRFVSVFRFLPKFKRFRNDLKIYAHIRKYG
jgi:glycosyltransferase involved in cell wall biosynthesis